MVTIEDALDPEVLLVEHLDGRPLDSDHWTPVRVVSRYLPGRAVRPVYHRLIRYLRSRNARSRRPA